MTKPRSIIYKFNETFAANVFHCETSRLRIISMNDLRFKIEINNAVNCLEPNNNIRRLTKKVVS